MSENEDKEDGLSSTAVLIISGIIVFVLIFGVFIFVEEVLGYKERYDGPDWFIDVLVLGTLAIGIFLWKLVAAAIGSRWGATRRKRP